MTISKDSVLAALIKANEKITELEKELSQRIRLDDPVVKGLETAITANLQALREMLRIFRQNGFIYPEGRIAINETKEALVAYNARLKEVEK